MTYGQKRLAVVGVLTAWIVGALAFDRYVLRDTVPWFSNMLYLGDAEIAVKPFSRTFSWLGLTLVIVAPSVAVGMGWSGYSAIVKKRSIRSSLALFGLTSFWFFLIPVLVLCGDVVYRFFKAFLDEWSWAKGVASFVEGFVLEGDVYIYSFKLVHVDSGLGALVGLMLGVALLYHRGLWNVIKSAGAA